MKAHMPMHTAEIRKKKYIDFLFVSLAAIEISVIFSLYQQFAELSVTHTHTLVFPKWLPQKDTC